VGKQLCLLDNNQGSKTFSTLALILLPFCSLWIARIFQKPHHKKWGRFLRLPHDSLYPNGHESVAEN